MRITPRQLRQLIREELLSEANVVGSKDPARAQLEKLNKYIGPNVTVDPASTVAGSSIGINWKKEDTSSVVGESDIANSVVGERGNRYEQSEKTQITETNLRKIIREAVRHTQNRFTDSEHRLASRLVDRLNGAVYDIAIERIKRDGHFLTPEEANEFFHAMFDEMGMMKHFDSLEDLRAAHSEFTDILMQRDD